MRPAFAFLISPLPATALLPLVARIGTPDDRISSLIFAYILFLFLQLIIAAPLRWLLAKNGWRSLWIDSGLGAVALALPTITYMVFVASKDPVFILVAALALVAILGAIVGLTYGLLRLRDRRASLAPTAADLAARFD